MDCDDRDGGLMELMWPTLLSVTSIPEHQGATFIGQEDVAAGMASFGLVAPAAIAVQAVELLA